MGELLNTWLFEQAPVIVFLAIGWWLLWRQNNQQQQRLQQLLDQCWQRILKHIDE